MNWLESHFKEIKLLRPITAKVQHLSPEIRQELKMIDISKAEKIEITPISWECIQPDADDCQVTTCDKKACLWVTIQNKDRLYKFQICGVCAAKLNGYELLMACRLPPLKDGERHEYMANGHCAICGEDYRGD